MMEEMLMDIIREIEVEKIEEKRHPHHALMIEIQRKFISRLELVIETMQIAGKIKVGHTINDRFIKIVE